METSKISDSTPGKLSGRQSLWVGLGLGVLLAVGGMTLLSRFPIRLPTAPNKTAPAANARNAALPVKVQTVSTSMTEETSDFVGSLEAQQKVTLQPQIQGRIEAILVSSGPVQ